MKTYFILVALLISTSAFADSRILQTISCDTRIHATSPDWAKPFHIDAPLIDSLGNGSMFVETYPHEEIEIGVYVQGYCTKENCSKYTPRISITIHDRGNIVFNFSSSADLVFYPESRIGKNHFDFSELVLNGKTYFISVSCDGSKK